MNTRFVSIIILLVALFAAWTYLGYENALSYQSKLDDLTQLPIYAYVADTTKVAPILAEVTKLPGIKSVTHETANQAATELIKAYGLPLNEEMISDYSFPDIITINFQPIAKALETKAIVLNTLRVHIPEDDIDSQAAAYSNISDELAIINRRNIAFHIFAGILTLLIFVFIRLSFELHILLKYQGKRHSVVDRIRHRKQGVQHTWTMLLIPLPLSLIGYFGLSYALDYPRLIPYWVFIAQFGAAFLATLVTHFILHTFEQDVAFNENPVQVIEPPASEEIL
jgi:cell division protein FtsX